MWLFVLFLTVPLIEIALFIQIGGLIGLWLTLLIVVVTAILGTALVRSQGLAELSRLRGRLQHMQDPTETLVGGAMILFSGALLLTPGFFTDAVGFALLVPGVRHRAFLYLKSRVSLSMMSATGPQAAPGQPSQSRQQSPRDQVVDGEFSEIDPEKRPTHEPSEWTRH